MDWSFIDKTGEGLMRFALIVDGVVLTPWHLDRLKRLSGTFSSGVDQRGVHFVTIKTRPGENERPTLVLGPFRRLLAGT